MAHGGSAVRTERHSPPPLPHPLARYATGHAAPRGPGSLAEGGHATEGSGGFHNIGNSCYINATLCALLGLRPFTHDMLRVFPPLAKFISQPSVYESLHSIVSARTRGELGASTPRRVKEAIARRCAQFAGSTQQDAH